MAAQLSHLPKCIGYNIGNILSYMPIYDLHANQRVLYYKKRIELTPPKVLSNFLRQSRTLPFKFRSDKVPVAQCDVLHDPSVYIINRKSLIINKPQVFYNDDSSDVHCLPLNKNVLKWSEGFMGDCMTIFSSCPFEEPIRSIALDMDFPKVGIFEKDGCYYDSIAYAMYSSLDDRLQERNYNFNFPKSSSVSAKVLWCLNNTTCLDTPVYMDAVMSVQKSLNRVDWDCKNQDVTWRDISTQEWSFDDNLRVVMKSDETLSIFGILGARNEGKLTDEIRNDAKFIISRITENKCAISHSLKVDNIIAHHMGEIIVHRMCHGSVVFPLLPKDLETTLLDNCPSIIVEDLICCWNAMNEKLVGISLMSPMFSDGVSDYRPSRMAPTWFCCPMPVYIHSVSSDMFNKNYSGFAYLPDTFRMSDRLLSEELTTCTTCIDHVAQMR